MLTYRYKLYSPSGQRVCQECHMFLGVSPELFHKLPGVLGREYLHLVRKAEVEPADRSKAVKVCV